VLAHSVLKAGLVNAFESFGSCPCGQLDLHVAGEGPQAGPCAADRAALRRSS
jgi:hypothetical protein